MSNNKVNQTTATSFFERVGVKKETIQVFHLVLRELAIQIWGLAAYMGRGEEASIMMS